MSVIIDFFNRLGNDILTGTQEHIYLTVVALVIAVAIAVPLGVYLTRTRFKKLSNAVMGFASMIQTVPALALLAFMVVVFRLVSLPTIGTTPALVALVLYALLPILRNTYTGINQVDPSVKEVALGMGMRPAQILFQVELPLSLPVIMAGIRISTVWTIGIATLAGLIGAGGLGVLILKGLRSIDVGLLLAGTIPAAILALVADAILSWSENWLTSGNVRTDVKSKGCLGFMALLLAGVIGYGLYSYVSNAIFYAPRADGKEVIEAGFDAEFLTRPDGYKGLSNRYGFKFGKRNIHTIESGLMYRAAANDDVDIINAFATDGRIPAYNLQVLVDDKGYFPPYYAVPIVRNETLERHPGLRSLINELGDNISNAEMQEMNYAVDEEQKNTRDVARQFLVEKGLIDEDTEVADGSEGRVSVASKNFTESGILGEMLAILIESNTDIEVKRNLDLDGTMICFNAMRSGEVDMYVEYTGTGLVNILKRDVVSDADKAYDIVKEEFDKKFDIAVLQPLGFNNTYTLTMRKSQAEELGIETISDLAKYVNELRKKPKDKK